MTHSSDPPEAPAENSAELRLSAGRLSAPVLCRVVSMMLARAECPLDKLDDAMLICDALCAHALDHVRDSHLAVKVMVRPHRLELRVDELSHQNAQALVQAAVLPEIGNVLERMSDELRVEAVALDDGAVLVLGLDFP